MPKRKFALLKRREEFQSHYTVLDIGTEFVKALIVKRENDKGIVLGVGKVRQAQTHMQAGAVADLQAVIDNCDRALTEAEDMCETIPGQAVIGIAGEQVRGFSTTMTMPRPQPQARITQADLATALQAVQRRALREAVRQMSHDLGVQEVNVKLVHSTITSVRIDGYAVSNPVDFQGHVVEITVFNTFAPLTHIGALQAIASELDLELVATVAEPYALARGCSSAAASSSRWNGCGSNSAPKVLIRSLSIWSRPERKVCPTAKSSRYRPGISINSPSRTSFVFCKSF